MDGLEEIVVNRKIPTLHILMSLDELSDSIDGFVLATIVILIVSYWFFFTDYRSPTQLAISGSTMSRLPLDQRLLIDQRLLVDLPMQIDQRLQEAQINDKGLDATNHNSSSKRNTISKVRASLQPRVQLANILNFIFKLALV